MTWSWTRTVERTSFYRFVFGLSPTCAHESHSASHWKLSWAFNQWHFKDSWRSSGVCSWHLMSRRQNTSIVVISWCSYQLEKESNVSNFKWFMVVKQAVRSQLLAAVAINMLIDDWLFQRAETELVSFATGSAAVEHQTLSASAHRDFIDQCDHSIPLQWYIRLTQRYNYRLAAIDVTMLKRARRPLYRALVREHWCWLWRQYPLCSWLCNQ